MTPYEAVATLQRDAPQEHRLLCNLRPKHKCLGFCHSC